MIKSRSYSSVVTRATSAERVNSPLLLFNSTQVKNPNMLVNPFPNPYPLKFPKKPLHKATAMNMLIQTEQSSRKLCIKSNQNAHKVTMLEPCFSKRELKAGQFSYLAYQSPSKPIRERQFEDIGAMSNRRRPNKDQNSSVSVLASINEYSENVGPDKYIKNIEKKHYKVTNQVKKQLQWAEEKPSKQLFQMKYRRIGREGLKQKTNQQSSYSSIHLKYTAFK